MVIFYVNKKVSVFGLFTIKKRGCVLRLPWMNAIQEKHIVVLFHYLRQREKYYLNIWIYKVIYYLMNVNRYIITTVLWFDVLVAALINTTVFTSLPRHRHLPNYRLPRRCYIFYGKAAHHYVRCYQLFRILPPFVSTVLYSKLITSSSILLCYSIRCTGRPIYWWYK